MFECMEIAEIIYKGVVTPSYKKNTREKPTVMDSVGMRYEKRHCQILTREG